jgi:putative uncharacterized protein (fragment)
MKKTLSYLKSYKKECILAPLFKLLEACFELFVPLVIADIIDIGISGGNKGYVWGRVGILALLAVCGLAFAITAQYFAAKAAVGFASKLRHALFTRIQSLSYADTDKLGTSTLITRMTADVEQVQQGVNMVLRLLLRSPFVVFGAAIMAFTVDAKSAVTFAVTIPVMSAAVMTIMLITIPLYKKVQAKLDSLLGITRENLSGVRVIRAFRKENAEYERFVSTNGDLTRSQKFVGRISALMNPLTYVLINCGVIALIWVGALRVNSGTISQGQVVALYNYMSQILVELVKLAMLIITLTRAVACAKRVDGVLTTENSMTENGDKEQKHTVIGGDVEFDGVELTYPEAGAPSLSGVNFYAPSGSTVGVIGGTGSGKTSLVNLIPRFYDVTKGCVKVGGTDVQKLDAETLRKNIGIVPQRAALFKGTIRSNLLWGKEDATDEELWEALKTAQAENVALDKGGLDAEVEQEGRNFSGGQRQRLTVARALVRKPKILILDDSASALDLKTDAALREAISKLDYKPTVFIVSQRAAAVMNAQLIVVLDEGAVVGMGTHDELMKTCPAYEEIYSSQFKKEAGR